MTIRPATAADIPHIVSQREGMFRDMQVPVDFPAMAASFTTWLERAMPQGGYRGWVAETAEGEVVAGAGLVVYAWPPGPVVMDGRCACVFNVYTNQAHRKQGLARRLMEAIHEWCRAEGIERVILNASRDGFPIYQAMGYVAADEPMMRLKL